MTTRTGRTEVGQGVDLALSRAVMARVEGPLTGVVRLRGRDARRFANGMFTNNVRDLEVGAWNRSAMVDDRARVGGFLDLLAEADDTFLAVLDGVDVAGFSARYDKYVVFDDVELEPWPVARWCVVGPEASRHAPWPDRGRFLSDGDFRAWGHRRAPCPSVELVAPEGQVPGCELPQVGADVLDALRILAGIPDHPRDTEDRRLPHELGLRDEVLHFEKGCYLGQEIIHRLDVMGRVRKQLVRLRFDGPVAQGDVVRPRDGDEELGTLTSVARLADDESVALAVLRVPYDEPGTGVVAGDSVRGRVAGA